MVPGLYSQFGKTMPLIYIVVFLTSHFFACSSIDVQELEIERAFMNPPDSARAHTWWHWVDGNVSKEGITKDLESFRAVGIDGFQLFDLGLGFPNGTAVFNSPTFHENITHTISEAERLGLEMGINSASGWSSTGGPWIEPEHSMKTIVWSEQSINASTQHPLHLARPALNEKQQKYDFYEDVAIIAFPTPQNTRYRLPNWEAKSMTDIQTRPDGFVPSQETAPLAAIIRMDDILLLTDQMEATGLLNWKPESGDWTVLRLGYTTTAAVTRPASRGGIGLELDKLSKEAAILHWEALLDKVIADADQREAFTTLLIDSYEVGCQNWTDGFENTFQQRNGYDLLPRLVCLTGRIVENSEYTERVLWDLRKTVADEMFENYFKFFAEKCHENGIKLASEPYGTGSFDAAQVAALVDLPMTEFWHTDKPWPKRNLWEWTSHIAASAAHLTGRAVVGAEAYTRMAGDWTVHPYIMKVWGDRAFTMGVNRFYFHTSAHQPWSDAIKPGMTMGRFGSNIHRNNTWFYQSKAWMDYIARCQYIMQSSRYMTDILVMYGDERGFNSFIGNKEPVDMEYIDGYKFDLAGIGTLDHLSVDEQGNIRASHEGKLIDNKYKLLYLKRSSFMRLETIEKLADLADQGALIIAPKPQRTPGLTDYIVNDRKLAKIIEKYWDTGIIQLPETYEKSVREIMPDCILPKKFEYSHHKLNDGDYYFISNQSYEAKTLTAKFRVSGRQPEIWNPETGEISVATNWKQSENGSTEVGLEMSPAGAVFVVFRKDTDLQEVSTPSPVYEEILALNQDWEVIFDPNFGPKASLIFRKLIPWNEHSDEEVKYYSGTASYITQFDFDAQPSSVILDLGRVDVIAEVFLNGTALATLWKPPFQVDISDHLNKGKNDLVIKVTNLWPNRLIGDAKEPELAEIKGKTYQAFPDWTQNGEIPSSSNRKTYTPYEHWKADAPLLPSGLQGPVKLIRQEKKQ